MKRLDKNILAARMGLEKESLRVDRRGRLAQTFHPFPEDAELDVDFSGNQLEFVTDVCDSADEVWGGRYNKVTLKKVSKIKCFRSFPNTETKHFHHDFEENLPGLDSK